MKFDSLKINGFGKLVKKEFNLKPGINIIYGENEAGKSSLLKFLTSMLYGASKNKNGKSITDFDRYNPWTTEEFSGLLEYTLDNGDKFEVYREFKKKNPSIYNSQKEDISKTFKENKTKGIQFFEEQTGIDEETYLNTAIIEQEEVKLDQSMQNNIVQKISNKVSSGDDNVSYKKALTQINKMQTEKIGTERTQNKPMNIITAEIKKLEEKRKELEEIKEGLAESEKEFELFKEKVENKEKEKNEKISKLSEDLNIENPQKKPHTTSIYVYIAIALIYIISILLIVFLSNKLFGIITCIIATVITLFCFTQSKNKVKAKHLQETKDTLKIITEEIKVQEKEIEKMKKSLYEIEFCKDADNKKLEELPAVVEKLDKLYEEQEDLIKLNNAYNIAKDCLEKAYDEVKKNISPKFITNLCNIISKISDGKYKDVSINDDEGLIVQIENGNYVSAERLSIGTIDQMYLSLRLSTLKEITDEKMPIVLDEAFAYFDNQRLENILKYLNEECKENQIIILTCSNREEDVLKSLKIPYTWHKC